MGVKPIANASVAAMSEAFVENSHGSETGRPGISTVCADVESEKRSGRTSSSRLVAVISIGGHQRNLLVERQSIVGLENSEQAYSSYVLTLPYQLFDNLLRCLFCRCVDIRRNT